MRHKLSILAALLLFGCARVQYVPTSRVERVIDTITRTVPDSAVLKMLFECDSANQVRIRQLEQYKGKEASQEVVFKYGALKVETNWRTQYIDRVREVHDTTTVVKEVEVIREVQHVPAFFWWCFGIALLAILYIVYKIIRKFNR